MFPVTNRFFDRRPIVNEDLLGQILQGRVVVKPNLKAFTSTGVMFEDGTMEENIDAVVFCTGFKDSFPFLAPSLLDGPKGQLQLYKYEHHLNKVVLSLSDRKSPPLI